MTTLKFKTNINCGGCISAVTPFLNSENKISHWEVNTNEPDKTLTVEGENITSEEVQQLVQEAGFKAEAKEDKKGLFGKLFG